MACYGLDVVSLSTNFFRVRSGQHPVRGKGRSPPRNSITANFSLRGDRIPMMELLVAHANPELVHHRFPQLDCGSTGARRLTLVDENGIGGQPPIFHPVIQRAGDRGLAITKLLLERGAGLAVRAKLPGHYERPNEIVECTPLGYALRFPGEDLREVEATGLK